MRTNDQDRVRAFVREIISARTGESVELTDQPELKHRNIPAVEELSQSASHRYAVEHTRIESDDSSVVLYSDIEGDPDALWLERVRRAFDEKCPKLAVWASEGRTSLLVLESNDIWCVGHRNAQVAREPSSWTTLTIAIPTPIGQNVVVGP
jgi:hypothetical protein